MTVRRQLHKIDKMADMRRQVEAADRRVVLAEVNARHAIADANLWHDVALGLIRFERDALRIIDRLVLDLEEERS